jgi:hypothetical protein
MNQQPNVNSVNTAVATLPGGFNGIVFNLVTRGNDVVLAGVVAAHTSLRALWGGIKSNNANERLGVLGNVFELPQELNIVAKGAAGQSEWALVAYPNLVPATEESVRAYAAQAWPLPPFGSLLDQVRHFKADTVLGDGTYLLLPPLKSETWPNYIEKTVKEVKHGQVR